MRRHNFAKKVAWALVCFGAGAIINWCVAWGCCLWLAGSLAEGKGLGTYSESREAVLKWLPPHIVKANPKAFDNVMPRGAFSLFPNSGPALRFDKMLYWVQPGRVCQLQTLSAGWPIRCLTTSSWLDDAGQRASMATTKPLKYDWGVQPPAWLKPQRASSRTWPPGPLPLPTRPLWPEFLGGATLYGLLLVILYVGSQKARALWRKRRGRCGKCGYDLHGNVTGVCPECGVIFAVIAGPTSESISDA
jgi:hypothetical protein